MWLHSVFKWAKGQNQCWWLQRGNDWGGKRRLCVLSALSVCFYGLWGSSQLSGLLRPAASITPISSEGENESEKSVCSFPLIMCVYSITISKHTVLLVITTALRGLYYIKYSRDYWCDLCAHNTERFQINCIQLRGISFIIFGFCL